MSRSSILHSSILLMWLVVLIAGPAVVDSVAAQEAAESKPGSTSTPPAQGGRYEFRTKHDPNGIGKFYMGREIAHVMGFIAAD